MLKEQRIDLDYNSLKQQKYKKIKLVNIFDYDEDYETCVTVYKAKKNKQWDFKYFFPNELNPDILWDKITKELKVNVVSYHSDFISDGIIFNALIDNNGDKSILLIKYIPKTGEIIKKAATFDG